MPYYDYKICNTCCARVACEIIIVDEDKKETCPFCHAQNLGPVMMNYEKDMIKEMLRIIFAE